MITFGQVIVQAREGEAAAEGERDQGQYSV